MHEPTAEIEQSILYREVWVARNEPFRVGRSLVICPRGVPYTAGADDRMILLDLVPDDPSDGLVFGTGAHPTTQLALELLEAHVHAGARVLDVGTGSGVLALAAARLGAREVLAVDVDPAAVVAARANVALNGLADTVRVREGSVEAVDGAPYDVVVANILAPVIRKLAPDLARLVRPGGALLVAGVIASQAASIRATMGGAGFEPVAECAAGDWRAFGFRRPWALWLDARPQDLQEPC